MDKTTLLLVEDNIVLRDALKEVLSMEGFHVFTAPNGKEALSIMEVVLPNLIISDVTMPDMGGKEFFKIVREHSKWVTIPFIFLTAHGSNDAVVTSKSLGAEDYLTKPINQNELVATIKAHLERAQQLELARLQGAYEDSLTVLTDAIEARDRYTIGHIDRVRIFAEAVGEALGWNKEDLLDLRFGAILHDIGKIYVEESILCKEDPLNAKEWDIIQSHPAKGAKMIKKIPYLAGALPIIYYHHERWDGSGYPDGLKGEDIPFGARIVAVADVYDAMTSTRIYRDSHTPEEAYREILTQSGILFDPEVVAAFKKLWEEGMI